MKTVFFLSVIAAFLLHAPMVEAGPVLYGLDINGTVSTENLTGTDSAAIFFQGTLKTNGKTYP